MTQVKKTGGNDAVSGLGSMRAYTLEFGGAMVAYVGVLMGVIATRPHTGTEWVEVLPAIPLLLGFWAIIRQYRRMDEFYKRIHAQAFALGAMILGLIVTIWGFAENAGVPALPTIWVGPALIALWGLCLPIVIRRY
ncbi:hypothetical protein [Fretibacter rubidus]|uniref:hypothetical protein n=1 Tax=Fretibacter rubidus TaxID=570162 RepID=UPI00352A708F